MNHAMSSEFIVQFLLKSVVTVMESIHLTLSVEHMPVVFALVLVSFIAFVCIHLYFCTPDNQLYSIDPELYKPNINLRRQEYIIFYVFPCSYS